MSSANIVDEDNAIEVGSMTWKSEADYDADGEPICIYGPGPLEGPASPVPSESPPPIQPE